jgi:hypothetical protein
LSETERVDVLRAGIGYTMGDDGIGLIRFREKYAAKMGDGPDRRAFDVVTAPIGNTGTEFREIARTIAAVDTLEAFLRDLRMRYPDTGAMPGNGQRPQVPPAAQAPRTTPAVNGASTPAAAG